MVNELAALLFFPSPVLSIIKRVGFNGIGAKVLVLCVNGIGEKVLVV